MIVYEVVTPNLISQIMYSSMYQRLTVVKVAFEVYGGHDG